MRTIAQGRRSRQPLFPDNPLTKTEKPVSFHRTLRHVARRCDGAVSRDRGGSSKPDAGLGNQLARQTELSPRQAARAKRLIPISVPVSRKNSSRKVDSIADVSDLPRCIFDPRTTPSHAQLERGQR